MKTHHLVGLCLSAVISSAIMAAPTIAASNGDENSPLKDSWLTAKTKMALFADPRVKGRQIQVETTQGQVSFRGMVDSEEASQTSEDIAKGISGVKGVTNLLEVAPLPAGRTSAQEDGAITARIKDHITTDMDKRLEHANIGVQTSEGTVSLTGEVPDLSTSAHASWTAWKTPGVKAVKNDLTITEKKDMNGPMPRS